MFTSFRQVIEETRRLPEATVSVAAAQDREVLEAIKLAYDQGIAHAILVGDEGKIRSLAEEVGLPSAVPVIHEADVDKAAARAVDLIRQGQAQVYMKGALNSGNYLRAALDRDRGLTRGRILSMMAGHELPDGQKLLFVTDGGVSIAPTLDEKKQILLNALEALIAIGIERPKVAVLAANEVVNPKMPVTLVAKAVAEAARLEDFPPCLVEGPLAIDVAASARAARIKGIESQVAGDVDLLLVPDIEAGNILGKALVIYGKAKGAGVILGASHPIVLTSRSESAEIKLNSIALACLIAAGQEA